MVDGLRDIYRTTGIAGLWRGADAAVVRTMIGSATQLTTYAFSKDLVRRSSLGRAHADKPWLVEAGGAMLSGVAVAVAMNPFDVISTRLYNQSPTAPLYSGYGRR
jgi:solute carrier family 25, member 34/35